MERVPFTKAKNIGVGLGDCLGFADSGDVPQIWVWSSGEIAEYHQHILYM